MNGNGFEPKIVAFLCNWCAYSGADLAGVSRMECASSVLPIRVMCSGRIDPTFVLGAFARGADAVLMAGCHPGDCHYQEGNQRCLRRKLMLDRVLDGFGIEPERLRLEWISASEAEKYAAVTQELDRQIREIGPMELQS
jgi:F420-non-reducing hydrogenase iron-sulfur subunit